MRGKVRFIRQKMLSKITNYFHILKARIVVAYALFHVFEQCCGSITRRSAISFLIRHPLIFLSKGLPIKTRFKDIYEGIQKTYNILYKDFFQQYIAHRKTPLADYVYVPIDSPALGSYFPRIIGAAWLCEKLGINVKFTFPDTYITGGSNFFESPILNYAKTCHPENFTQLKKPLVKLSYKEKSYPSIWEVFAKREISSEYGYEIISKLSIKQEIQQQANQWSNANIKKKCVGVHYRQTDVIHATRVISIDSYIDYLRQVIDDHYQIYACSDTAPFIDAIHKAFPGRVVSRDITRSHDGRSLHRHEPYAGHQQRQDALIDILTLAKLKVIYTVGSSLIDIIRFFNPEIKIIALNSAWEIWYENIPNFIPIPHVDLVRKAQADIAWKEGLHYNKFPNIEVPRTVKKQVSKILIHLIYDPLL